MIYVCRCLCVYMFRVIVLCYGDHRVLHSFPTRRSSDLGNPAPSSADATTAAIAAFDRAASRPPTRARCARSEEHTSELQSRVDIVCRLLLEKKKRKAALVTRQGWYIQRSVST